MQDKFTNKIKNKLQSHRVTFDSNHWNQMENMLDAQPALVYWNKKRILGAVAAVSLFLNAFLIGYFFLQPFQDKNQDLVWGRDVVSSLDDYIQTEKIVENTTLINELEAKNKYLTNVISRLKTENKELILFASQKNNVEKKNETSFQKNESDLAFIPPINFKGFPVENQDVNFQKTSLNGFPETSKLETPNHQLEPSSANYNSSFGFYFSPEIASVNGQYASEMSFSTGIALKTSLGKKWALTTGLGYGKKYYEESLLIEKNTLGNWLGFNKNQSRELPSNVFGDYLKNYQVRLKSIEMPLALAFQISENPRTNTYLSLGFTGYYLFDGEYTYTYLPKQNEFFITRPEYSSSIYTNGEENNTEQYFYGMLNFGIGQDVHLNNFVCQVEPYFQMPLFHNTPQDLPVSFGVKSIFSLGK